MGYSNRIVVEGMCMALHEKLMKVRKDLYDGAGTGDDVQQLQRRHTAFTREKA